MAIYYLCPDFGPPSGGTRVIYRHVDILAKNGIDAYVVHERQNFRCRWFENDTPVLGWSRRRAGADHSLPKRTVRYARRGFRRTPSDRPFLPLLEPPSFAIASDDVVVIPETFGPRLADIAPGVPKVIFNQNVYFTYFYYPGDPRDVEFPYRHPDVVATFAISEDSRRFMEYVFPAHRIHRVRWSIDPKRFHFEEPKLPRICYMPRRGSDDAAHVLATLAARKALGDFEIMAISGLGEDDVASRLRQSLVFLSLGYHEGLPRPPAEAMACGAIVVGYDGFGGREYLLPDLAYPVPAGDLAEFARRLEEVLRVHSKQPELLRERAVRAASFIAETYAPKREEEELLAAWDDVVAGVRRTP
jgi:glycosyltransferase involved in cell wall biosynthesis